MSEWNREEAIMHWRGLQQLLQVGAYQERGHEGKYGEDGIEEEAFDLECAAAERGLQFVWHDDQNIWSLEQMSPEEIALFKAATEPQEATLMDCPYCHGAHYTGQRCPLNPQKR